MRKVLLNSLSLRLSHDWKHALRDMLQDAFHSFQVTRNRLCLFYPPVFNLRFDLWLLCTQFNRNLV